jgi:hypothetical protein
MPELSANYLYYDAMKYGEMSRSMIEDRVKIMVEGTGRGAKMEGNACICSVDSLKVFAHENKASVSSFE